LLLSHEWWVYATAMAASVLGVARIVRLVVFDDFPPSVVVRAWWTGVTRNGPWAQIVKCGFCLSPYLMVISWAWGWASNLHWTWWVAHLFAAAAYLASIVVAYDQPE
jgi:hypothetical protein